MITKQADTYFEKEAFLGALGKSLQTGAKALPKVLDNAKDIGAKGFGGAAKSGWGAAKSAKPSVLSPKGLKPLKTPQPKVDLPKGRFKAKQVKPSLGDRKNAFSGAFKTDLGAQGLGKGLGKDDLSGLKTLGNTAKATGAIGAGAWAGNKIYKSNQQQLQPQPYLPQQYYR